jgi:ATP-dependent Clp protease ATP-binding subunit ClpA
VSVTQRLSRVLDAADREAQRMKDSYVSVEHLLLALADEGSASGAGRVLKQHRPHCSLPKRPNRSTSSCGRTASAFRGPDACVALRGAAILARASGADL